MDSIDVLENVAKSCGRQIIWSKPPAEIGECPDDRRKCDADECQSCQRAHNTEVLPRAFCRAFKKIRHLQLQSNRIAESIKRVRILLRERATRVPEHECAQSIKI